MPYFDFAATTKPSKEVLDMYNKVNDEYWYNISGQYRPSVVGANLLQKASLQILSALNVQNKKIIFTSGATEANNTAIYGICNKYIGQNKHIITTSIEHASVLNCFKNLEEKGFEVTYLKVDKSGVIDLNELENAIKPNTIFISIMWVNNIVGTVMPIKDIINIVKKYPRIKLHVDAVQGIGKLENDFDFSNIDMFTLSGHKIHGVKGVGALVLNNNIELSTLIKGGHQQNNMRAGTVDLASILAFTVALKNAIKTQTATYNYVHELYMHLFNSVKDLNYLSLNVNKKAYSPFILSITFKNIKAETVMHFLERHDIYVGIGSACNEKTKTVDPILEYMQDKNLAINTIRVSFSKDNNKEEVDLLIEKIKEIGEK